MMNDRKTLREAKKDRRIKKEKIVEKTNKLNRKQQLLKKTAEQRMIFKNLTIEWQEKLYDPVDSTILQESAKYLLPHQYQEVIEERNAYNLCGYPLCSNNK
ncbi:hypothetical protein Glove_156g96 [Diversispora epigaea]|uniref:RNA polymerase II subunit B1 CTD phosphatase RPAP2 homolog n=1 Tax=Diversispora epigaea TaxID=1348612 RepID=A0A397IS29_9GLOM|nr:hypothetical protein Glove_156g96 [Diversispora epigaea]